MKLKHWYLIILVICGLMAQKSKPSPDKQLTIPAVFHHPRDVFLQGYPQDLDLIVSLPDSETISVLIFIRFNDSPGFLELDMKRERERYRYHFDPKQNPADSVEYYFIVTGSDSSVYAAPLDSQGNLMPVKRILADPQEYFRKRNLFK